MIVPPTNQALNLIDAKSYARVLSNDDDALITVLIDAATDYAEGRTNRQLCPATYEAIYSYDEIVNYIDFLGWRTALYGAVRIPKAPLISIASVQYQNDAMEWVVLDPLLYVIKYDYDVGIIEFTSGIPQASIKITYVAGYQIIPASIKAWMMAKVNTIYEYREEVALDNRISSMPESVIDVALNRFKVMYP